MDDTDAVFFHLHAKNLDNQNHELGLLMLKIAYSMKKVLVKSTEELYVPKTTVSNLKLIVS